MKICTSCGITKDDDDFPKHYDNRTGKTNLRAHCKLCHNAENAEYSKKHPEIGRRKVRKWERNNPEKVAVARRRRFNKRYTEDENFRIKTNFRNRIRKVLNGNSKSAKTIELLGCTIEEFKKYLEKQFYPNPDTGEQMTWSNYGFYGWHIDHIKPCDVFDLSDPKQQKECFNYKNQQPLWAKENLTKGAIWNPEK